VEISFEDWVARVFDHPVTEPEWYQAPDAADWDLSHERELQLVTQLFEQPAKVLRRFSDAQVNQGFWFLLGPRGDALRGLEDEHLVWELQGRCIQSFTSVFETLFAARCTPHLSHLCRTNVPDDPGMNPLNEVCFMWWHFVWVPRPEPSTHSKADFAFLEVMQQTLALPHDACRESALHGLGHWHGGYPTETELIIDTFLGRSEPIREELRDYAQQARQGCML
jgi:hypothetical protein